MSKVIDFPQREKIYDQASLWIARLDRELSAEEEQELAAWLKSGSEQRTVFLEMAKLWDKMDSLARLADLFEAPAKPRQRRPWGYAIAASFALAAMALAFSLSWQQPGTPAWVAWFGPNYQPLPQSDYETALGQHQRIDLPDGSVLTLNTNSRVHIEYTAKARLFYLERGELNIQVAHDTSRPLSVIAQGKVVQAVGTAFNVRIKDNDQVDLLVTEGKVRVAKQLDQLMDSKAQPQRLPETSLAVSKGEKLVLSSQQPEKVARMDDSEIAAELSWRQGNLVFRGETLEQALNEIGRYTSVKFEIRDPAIKQKRIAGMFKAGDVDGLLTALQQNFNIQYQRINANQITLEGNLR